MLVVNCGTVWTFRVENEVERDWVKNRAHVESWQWTGDQFTVDHRCGAELAMGMQSEGLDVKDGSPKPRRHRRRVKRVRPRSVSPLN